jgi:RNA recognition motif-containing protein
MNIYVGNLAWGTSEDDLYDLFAAYGEVTRATIISEKDTGRSKGFGFVEMASDEEAQAAISGLDGSDIGGRDIRVNEARPRPERRERY